MRKCSQTKCGYYGTPLCPECPDCKAKPNEVDDTDMCVECYCCEKDMGYIRGGVPAQVKALIKLLMEKEQEKEKEIEVEIK